MELKIKSALEEDDCDKQRGNGGEAGAKVDSGLNPAANRPKYQATGGEQHNSGEAEAPSQPLTKAVVIVK